MPTEIEIAREGLNDGTESLQQVPIAKIKETFENTVNVTPTLTDKISEIGSLIIGTVSAIEKAAERKPEAANHLFDARQGYQIVYSPINGNPTSAGTELGIQFGEVSQSIEDVIGAPNRWGSDYELVKSLIRMRAHLTALSDEVKAYEDIRNGILERIDHAEDARTRTIDQANLIISDL